MDCNFKIGDRVKRIGFASSDGDFVPESAVLIVTDVRLIPATSIPAYHRIAATHPMRYDTGCKIGGIGFAEGAERFFARA